MVIAGNVVDSGDAFMSDAVNEQLSACLDGELPPAELALLLKRVERDAGLRDTMGRYALVGEALRNDKPVVASRDFAANVMAAIAAEPARSAGRVPAALLRRLRPVAGMAVAAGVAAVAILSIQRVGVSPELTASEQTSPAAVAATTTLPDPSYVVPEPSTAPTPAFAVPAARLTNYVVAHSEYSSPLGRRSVLTGVLADDDADEGPVSDESRDAAAATQPQER
jgi:sigma-E factor negative regulatory protein RseA